MKTITIEVTCQQSVEVQIDKLDNSEGILELIEDLDNAKKENDGWLIEQTTEGGQVYFGKQLFAGYGPLISYDSEFCFTDESEKEDPYWFTWEEIHTSVETENEDFALGEDVILHNDDLISFRIKFTEEPVMTFQFSVEDDFILEEDILDKIVIQLSNIRTKNVEYLEEQGMDLLSGITLMGEEPDNFDINEVSDESSVHCESILFQEYTGSVPDVLTQRQIFEFDDYVDILEIHSNYKSLLSEKIKECKRKEQL